jgi:predicted dinucleotide-binding enzyme
MSNRTTDPIESIEGVPPVERVAILGAGRVGTALARALVDAGYTVTLAGASDPGYIEMIVSVVVPGARADWAANAVADADMIILSLPLHRIRTVDAELLSGRLVVDAMNYWPPVDGEIAEFEDAAGGTSSIVRQILPRARVVKTFNHTGYHDLEPDRRPPGHEERRAMAIAGDDPSDVAMTVQVVERIGYDAVLLDSLAAGRLLQPGQAAFGARLRAADIRQIAHRVPLATGSRQYRGTQVKRSAIWN